MRFGTAELDRIVSTMLARHLVDDPDAPANYSVLFEEDEEGSTSHHLCLLYLNSVSVARSRTPVRVIKALLRHLGAYAASPDPALVRMSSIAFIGDDGAIVVPRTAAAFLDALEPRTRRMGLRLLHDPVLSFDAASGELVVPETALTVDGAPLAALEAAAPTPEREGAPVEPGRYPVRAWVFEDWINGVDNVVQTLTRAGAVAAGARVTVDIDNGQGQRTLEAIAAMMADVPTLQVRWAAKNEVLAALSELRG